jgi:hypothetical protein
MNNIIDEEAKQTAVTASSAEVNQLDRIKTSHADAL